MIGEGELDEAPMLFIGERLGSGGTELDVTVDPVEGTDAVTVCVAGEFGGGDLQSGLRRQPMTYAKGLLIAFIRVALRVALQILVAMYPPVLNLSSDRRGRLARQGSRSP